MKNKVKLILKNKPNHCCKKCTFYKTEKCKNCPKRKKDKNDCN